MTPTPADFSTFVQRLRLLADQRPQDRAYTFLLDGDSQEAHISYGELDRQARAVAAVLQQHGMTGQRVLLLYPPGLDYVAGFLGCLYAGAVAVPAYPPNPMRLDRTLPRLQSMVADAQAAMALTTQPILQMAPLIFAMAPDLAAMQWIATDTLSGDGADQWQEPSVTPDTLAFLQYTSGSTRAPRGVMLTHGNLLHNSAEIMQAFETAADDVGMIWLPPYHDMGLIGGILQPLYRGFHAVLMSPISLLQRPLRWVQAISKYRATVSGGPNFAYDLCARKVTAEQKQTLDLSTWKVAFNGAEPVRAETIERFTTAFAACGFRRQAFYPCYGLAEATLIVSGGARSQVPPTLTVDRTALTLNQVVQVPATAEGASTLVGCGHTLHDQQILIVDPDSLLTVGPAQVGEIWVRGPSVAQGYWNQPEETERVFRGFLASDGSGPFLRTGDLGFLDGDELYIGGRIKDLIIIDGLNHYPQDIEQTIENLHPAFRPGCSAAFSVDSEGAERLVVVAELRSAQESRSESGQTLDAEALRSEVIRAISERHELRTHEIVFLKAGGIPKTSSGKVQRHACKAAYLTGTLERWSA